jgi:hypothetical protein
MIMRFHGGNTYSNILGALLLAYDIIPFGWKLEEIGRGE